MTFSPTKPVLSKGVCKHREGRGETSGLQLEASGHGSSSVGRSPEPALGARAERDLCSYQGISGLTGIA